MPPMLFSLFHSKFCARVSSFLFSSLFSLSPSLPFCGAGIWGDTAFLVSRRLFWERLCQSRGRLRLFTHSLSFLPQSSLPVTLPPSLSLFLFSSVATSHLRLWQSCCGDVGGNDITPAPIVWSLPLSPSLSLSLLLSLSLSSPCLSRPVQPKKGTQND